MIAAEQVSVVIEDAQLLDAVSFDVSPGEALAVTGPNGAGKTTLLKVIAGLIRPSTGTLSVHGIRPDERRPEFRALVAALLGTHASARNLTLREHLVLVAASWGEPIRTAEARAEGLLRDFTIDRLATRFPHELSSGQQQLFALALTLTRPFEVLLLDEPEQHLDGERLQLLGAVLRGMVDGGATVVFTSHSSALVEQVADRTLHLVDADHAQHL